MTNEGADANISMALQPKSTGQFVFSQASLTENIWVMRITADRRIEVNEDVEVTEAAQKVLDAMRCLLAALPVPVREPVAGQPLPCPFCGHIGLDFSDGETYRWGVASCGGCGASCGDVRREYPDHGEWHTEAIAEWNKRSPAAQRQWVGMTPEKIDELMYRFTGYELLYAIQAELKENNT
jgi:hypothetical protein